MTNTMKTVFAAGFALAASGASAQVLTFSVASDNSSDTPTFLGNGGALGDAPGNSGFTLLVDDANGSLPTLEFTDLSFIADFGLESLGSVAIMPGVFTHQYLVNGFFAYVDATGANLLEASVVNAVLTVIGSADAWYTSGALVASDLEMSEITYGWNGGNFAAYGLFNGTTAEENGGDDGVFTLTLIDDGVGGPGVALGTDGLPLNEYIAEASFSGSARSQIPGPATGALLAIGGILAARRR